MKITRRTHTQHDNERIQLCPIDGRPCEWLPHGERKERCPRCKRVKSFKLGSSGRLTEKILKSTRQKKVKWTDDVGVVHYRRERRDKGRQRQTYTSRFAQCPCGAAHKLINQVAECLRRQENGLDVHMKWIRMPDVMVQRGQQLLRTHDFVRQHWEECEVEVKKSLKFLDLVFTKYARYQAKERILGE